MKFKGRLLAAFVALTAFSQAALSQGIPSGTYEASDSGYCGNDPNVDYRMEVTNNTIIFYESRCDLTAVSALTELPGAFLTSAQCMGEGDEWELSFIVMPSYDDSMIWVYPPDQYSDVFRSVTYAKCRSSK